jgi:uncharacterized protein (DUF433 family)
MARLQESPAMDWSVCPDVETVPGKVGGVLILKHSRMPPDAILENHLAACPPNEVSDCGSPASPVSCACLHFDT